jgi:hypothetical protein
MLTPVDMPPGYVLVISAPDDLFIEDAVNPALFIDAGVQDRILRFEVRAEERVTKNRSAVRGKVLFALMMRHFGMAFDVIAAYWHTDGVNLERFNRATAAGMREEAAGWVTWTGERAVAYGFTRLTVEETIGGPGRYGLVRVWYYR